MEPPSILLLTNEEHGQSNVFMATCESLLQLEPDAHLHLASFAGLADSVAAFNDRVRLSMPAARPVRFHHIRGVPSSQGLRQVVVDRAIVCHGDVLPKSFFAPLSFTNSIRAIRDTMSIFVPYTAPQMAEIVSSVVELVNMVGADLVVVDSLMTPALTACHHLGISFVCLSPNSIKDFAVKEQPLRVRLKHPALFSGHRYPVPLYLAPLNILYKIIAAVLYYRDGHRRKVAAHIATHTGATLTTAVETYLGAGAKPMTLVGSMPELDYPGLVPPYIIPCGPIIRGAPPVRDADPDLAAWLARAPTLYVNLGSLYSIHEPQALELARALKTVMGAVPRLQVLWKLKRMGRYGVSEPGDAIHDTLTEELKADRVRVVIDWLMAEPSSILESGHVICSMHHGGANSFYEAVVTGVPQVVLPQWTDTYDYAERVELLGIGRLGNETTKPRWTAVEVAAALTDVLNSSTIKAKASTLAKLCQDRGSGAANAARAILAECRVRKQSKVGEDEKRAADMVTA
ncbi:hypothetical protein XA68_18561 [Ophiocordyceps unilateralis]|uniref:Erythromycin biosynthesis protein CIII-like C-terminal domain-containing protein n=1 Tax=Ophiocordyceps unilateralis TaxID=268505 RepID=A0A2A9P0G8_OPHUN|nr:hypothetical protein XA68_18561 [Ophiocordyceps unilateralis]